MMFTEWYKLFERGPIPESPFPIYMRPPARPKRLKLRDDHIDAK